MVSTIQRSLPFAAVALSLLLGHQALLAQDPDPAASPSPPPAAKPDLKIDQAQIERSTGTITSFAPVVEKVGPSVVTIFSTTKVKRGGRGGLSPEEEMLRRFFGVPDQGPGPRGRREMHGLGSGIVVTKEGHILTSNHVIDGADQIMVSLGMDRKEYKAERIGTDPATDLAVLKIEAEDLHPVVFADSSKVRPGDVALAIGNPFGLTQSVSMGIVSAVGRGGMGITDYENFIQTDAAINMGNSGGALVDAHGRLIGVNAAIFSRSGGNQGIGFAVPSNIARGVMESLLENGRVVRGFIGVLVQPLSSELAEAFGLDENEGALVAEVTPEGPGDKGGVRAGDVIVRVNDEEITDPHDLQLTVAVLDPGSEAKLSIIRDEKRMEIGVTLGELPAKDGQVARTEPVGKSNVLDGITIGDIDEEAAGKFNIPKETKGVVVTMIDPECVGYAAGLREGDVIQEMNRKELVDAEQAVDLSNEIEKNETVLLRTLKKGRSHYLVLKPDEETE
jgi:serine protease Do